MTGRKKSVPGITVYPRGKKFAYNVDLGPDPLTGQRRREYKGGFATEHEALTAAVKAKDAADQGQRVAPNRRTVAAFIAEWLEAIRHELKPSSFTNYADYSTAYVVPILGRRRLQEIDTPVLNALYRQLLDKGRRKPDNNSAMYAYWKRKQDRGSDAKPAEIAKACGTTIYAARHAVLRYRRGRIPVAKSAGLAPKTVKNIHRMLHRAFSDAVAWRYLGYNPATHASLPRAARSRREGPTSWTAEELVKWLKVARRDRDAAMWVLAATTGMRRSELAGARRDLLDLEVGQIIIEPTRVVVAGKAEESDGKTAKSRRTIALDPITVQALRRHVAALDDDAKLFGASYSDSGLLFCHSDGKPLHPDTITRRFNALVDAADVRRIRLHDVRHTYVTLSLDIGANPKTISDRVGHASMAFTLSVYTHRSIGRDRETASQFADALQNLAASKGVASTSPDAE